MCAHEDSGEAKERHSPSGEKHGHLFPRTIN
jgi:hypothetical protein